MIIHDVPQGSPRWSTLRAGIPTASNFDKILTPKTTKPSTQADAYCNSLLAERIMGRPLIENDSSLWMNRGSFLEEEAVTFYEFTRDVTTIKAGFFTTDDGRIGASPDRLVSDDGLVEVKCPTPATHVGYLLSEEDNSVDAKYLIQLQGQLWITERRWVDIISYHPEMPQALVRVYRNEELIEKLSAVVRVFSDELEKIAVDLAERGWLKPIRFVEEVA